MPGLDSIRFVCALWVVFGHFGLPSLPFGKATLLGLIATGVYNNLTSGPAAVIIFFVISGLCIHLPHTGTLKIAGVRGYLVRRYLRIVPPMAVAIAISQWLGVKLALFEQTILWSLFAELIYYTLYPALLKLRVMLDSWSILIIVSFLLAVLVAARDPTAKNYPSFGIELNWLLGLPCWLFGCALAESLQGKSKILWGSIHWWRAGILMLSMAFSMARYHSPIGYPWTLNLFGVAAVAWLYQELVHFQRRPPRAALERAGKWSYSLYLVHPMAMAILTKVTDSPPVTLMAWCGHMLFICSFAYVFALLVEYPSHSIARKAAHRLALSSARISGVDSLQRDDHA